MSRDQLHSRLPQWVDAIVSSIQAEPRMRHLDRVYLPNRDVIVQSIDLLQQLIFPGYFGRQGLTSQNIAYRVGELMGELVEKLYDQVRCVLRYSEHIPDNNGTDGGSVKCDRHAVETVAAFLDKIPEVRARLSGDVQAAFDGDPAARSTDETIFCYPGLFAIFVQRIAHELYLLDVPLMPRIMTEHAHSVTGIDIHPGATLGSHFFIDHGTGVVIGETTQIGANVKIYQGVTLGALAPHFGQGLRGKKRHPTIEDDVTIYAGATILGGETVIGRGAVIGGNVFLTSSVPPQTQVSMETPRLKYRNRGPKSADFLDFSI